MKNPVISVISYWYPLLTSHPSTVISIDQRATTHSLTGGQDDGDSRPPSLVTELEEADSTAVKTPQALTV